MVDSFVVRCKCGGSTVFPLRSLQDITQHRKPSITDNAFANFVCPRCGFGARHLIDKLERRESTPPPFLVRLPLYRAFLQCGNPRCDLQVTVDTIAQSGAQNSKPKTAVDRWDVRALECPDGHHAKEPPVLKHHMVIAPEWSSRYESR